MTTAPSLYEEAAREFEQSADEIMLATCGMEPRPWRPEDAEAFAEWARLMMLAKRLRGRAIEGPCLCVAKPDGSCERCGISAHRTAWPHYPQEWGPSDARRLTCSVCGTDWPCDLARAIDQPDGYAVVQADGAFVGAWRDRASAELVLNRSQAAKGERIVAITVHELPVEPRT